ncbi:MAG: type 1 glutamine amidotransferase [Gaiellaceae bacterium]
MEILSIVHGGNVREGIFADPVRERGHELVEWRPVSGVPSPRPPEDYGAVLVFGGAMHADQEDQHPWLREEDALMRRLIEARTPVLGICLGAQLLAKAAGARVAPLREPEIGWFPTELTESAAHDPVVGRLPRTFDAFQWHSYAFEVPDEAEELARSEVCSQAFRLGDSAWAVQFHPEVTLPQVEGWIDDPGDPCPDPEGLRAETRTRIAEWNELGRMLCGAFLETAERLTSSRRV